MTRWEHRTVIVTCGDDGPVNSACDEGWEPYGAVPAELYGGPGTMDGLKVAVLLRRATVVA